MNVVRTVKELRATLDSTRSGTIGLVPTMGALHEGHLSLVAAARGDCSTVVMSIFVNPTQFDDPADLAAYTRNEERDLALAQDAGVDVVFLPDVTEMYPSGFATTVQIRGTITETLEGGSRGSGHFDGMATIVTKLFNAVAPDRAYFGAKDAQQAVVVRRLINDLNMPIELIVCPTSRDPDGLARSSRNTRLSVAERERALAIPNALQLIRQEWRAGVTGVNALHERAVEVLDRSNISLEYLAFVEPDTLEAVDVVNDPTLVLIAATVGETRLIDNVLLSDDAV